MRELIRKWLDIPTKEELYERIDKKVISKVTRSHNKLRKADQSRYQDLIEKNPDLLSTSQE